MARVSDTRTTTAETGDGVERWPLVPPERGSELALDALRIAPAAAVSLTDPLHDTELFVHAGSGEVELGGARHRFSAIASAFVPCGAEARLIAGDEGVTAVRVTLGANVDLHAPMGDAAAVVALDAVAPGKATGARAFQVLHGPHNGSTRGTTFVGYIPPGKAPWHYHLYDEVLWVLRGTGRLHLGDTTEQLSTGSSFRLHARDVHIVENTDPVTELAILGIFTPAGSPSAAYLEPGVAAAYAIA
jgi:quercetin dioxygenase-like cupin family protein